MGSVCLSVQAVNDICASTSFSCSMSSIYFQSGKLSREHHYSVLAGLFCM